MDKKVFTLRDNAIRDTMKCYADAIQLDPEKPIDVIFQDHRKDRTLAQNRLMWDWLTPLSKHLRNENGLNTSPESLKDHFQREILGFISYQDPETGEMKTRVKGTSEASVKEFSELLDAIDRYAANIGLQLHHPDDRYYEAMGARR